MTDSCKHVLRVKTSIQLGILTPERWHCNTCHTTESVWACLSCNNFACGRYIAEHSLKHFQTTGHPLCIEVNEKFVFCYLCDDFVLNDNAPGDIKLLQMALDAVSAQDFHELSKQKRGRRILRYHVRDAKKNSRRLVRADDIYTAVVRHRITRLSCALRLWWTRYLEAKNASNVNETKPTPTKRRPLTLTPAFTGLRNLGNTCYMNSILQVLRHTAPFANFVMSHTLQEVNAQSRKRRQDLSASDAELYPAKRFLLSPFTGVKPAESSRLVSTCSLDANSTPVCMPDSPSLCEQHCSIQTAHSGDKSSEFQSMNTPAGGLNGGQCPTKPNTFPTSNTPQSIVTPDPSLYEELHNLFHILWSGQRTVVSPSNLLYAVWTALPTFKGYKQQDAQEFLSLLLDRLQAELHGVPVHLLSNTRDFINRTFQGYSVSHVRCSVCNVTACTEEPVYELSLSLPLSCYSGESTECNLVDLLRQFVSPSPIDGASYVCRECNRRSMKLMEPKSQFNLSNSTDFESDSCSPNPTSFAVDKYVSISLSRLSSPSTIISSTNHHLRLSDFAESSSSSSSLSESALSTSPSLTSLDDMDDGNPVGKQEHVPNVRPNSEPNERPVSPLMNSTIQNNPMKSPFRTPATQTIRLSRLPRVLRLHIKRFRWVGRQREKLSCHVAFPLILDMTEFMLRDVDRTQCGQVHAHDNDNQFNYSHHHTTPDQKKANMPRSYSASACTSNTRSNGRQYLYHLTGVVVHHGRGFQSGHYTAYCLNDEPECWLHCNDAHVTLCDFNEVSTAQAYLLFYSELMPKAPYPTWFNSPSKDRNKLPGSIDLPASPLLQLKRTSSTIAQSSTSNETTPQTESASRHPQGLKYEDQPVDDGTFSPGSESPIQSRLRHSSSWSQTSSPVAKSCGH